MVFEQVAIWVVELAHWGITILVIMLAIEVWKFISFDNKAGEKVKETGSSLFNWAQKKNPLSSEGRKQRNVERDAKREKTKILNEIIEEKKELELVEKAKAEAEEYITQIDDFEAKRMASSKPIPLQGLLKGFADLKKTIKEAGKEIRRLKRTTFRQERQSKKLIQDLEDAEVNVKEVEKVKALENQILAAHDAMIKHFEGMVIGSLKRIEKELTARKSITVLKTAVENLSYELDNTIKNLKQSYKDVEGLMALFQKYWKQ